MNSAAADWPLWRSATWPLIQDEVGPIARTVTDAALLLDVRAGYDAADPITAFAGATSRRATRGSSALMP